MNDNFKDTAEKIDYSSQRSEYLWKQLKNLADESGRVRDADKRRAEFILGELNDALGTEYTMTGNQIDRYKELSREIDNVIAKKKAESYLSSFYEMSADMEKQKAESKKSYEVASADREKAKSEMESLEKLFNVNDGKLGFTSAEIASFSKESDRIKLGISELQYETAVRYETAKQNYSTATSLAAEARRNYDYAMEYFNKLKDAEAAFMDEDYTKVNRIIFDAEIDFTGFEDDANAAFDEAMKTLSYDLKLVLNAEIVNQDEIDETLRQMGETFALGQQNGLQNSKIFTPEMIQSVQEMVDKGLDISELAKWAKDSGIDIADVFGDNYEAVIQKQIDSGFDIRNLLLWAENSGKDISKHFTKEFKEYVGSQLDLGVDTTGLVEWAINEFGRLGALCGDEFNKTLSQYLYKNNDLIPMTINSESDANYRNGKNGTSYYPRKYASGGFIPSGRMGIVAESGVEFLQPLNGGILVTPSRTSSNAASSETATKNFYNNYTINATVKNDYDISSIARKLSDEQRRIELGKGLK